MGFRQGQYNPCLYYHPTHDITALEHGDEFASVGGKGSTDYFRTLLHERFTINATVIGEGEGTNNEGR